MGLVDGLVLGSIVQFIDWLKERRQKMPKCRGEIIAYSVGLGEEEHIYCPECWKKEKGKDPKVKPTTLFGSEDVYNMQLSLVCDECGKNIKNIM